jgi:ketosteroid isomerase-like protein
VTYEERCTLLDRFFAALVSGDAAGVEAGYHPDARIWHNNDGREQCVADNLRTLRWIAANVKDWRYEDVRRADVQGGRVLQQHVLRGLAPDGSPLQVPACIIFSFGHDGRITRLEEYLDTAHVQALLR